MTHTEHTKTAQLLRCVEHHRRESRRHFRIQSDFNTRLHFILALHKQIQQCIGVNHSLAEVGHHSDEICIPLVRNLCERCRTRRHQDCSATIFKLLLRFIVNFQESLRGHFLSCIILKLPHAFALRELFLEGANLRQDTDFETAHVEQHVRIIFGVDGSKGVVPHQSCHTPWQSVLHLPEYRSSQVDVMLHATHAAIPRPTHLIVVTHHVFIVRIRVLSQETLNKISRFLLGEAEHHDEPIQISAIKTDRVSQLGVHILECQELVG
mmetsp:Transcript_52988/g.84249  ORF Transcript_52988/g.84249 Transcript_52988/m.84249 type:complete len:266 (+) Transcript_52988:2003-2800(+)